MTVGAYQVLLTYMVPGMYFWAPTMSRCESFASVASWTENTARIGPAVAVLPPTPRDPSSPHRLVKVVRADAGHSEKQLEEHPRGAFSVFTSENWSLSESAVTFIFTKFHLIRNMIFEPDTFLFSVIEEAPVRWGVVVSVNRAQPTLVEGGCSC